ncbi:MAG: alpha/beta fold hydrolase [Caldilineaceae bacterium]|nr:alpha/beta fold hydrolase [Caldilineaceae bacterium]
MYTILEPTDSRAKPPRQGVALVVHGLNLKPDWMRPVADVLRARGVAVVLCSLRGHGANFTPVAGATTAAARLAAFRQVSYAAWRAELMAAYQAAAALAQPTAAPIFLVAFSLGALLGCELLATTPTVHLTRLVLLAPALALRPYSYLPALLAPWPLVPIRSLAPAPYRANPATPVAAYRVLYQALHNLWRQANARLNVPTLVLVDPHDELVSLRGIRRFLQQAQLSQWRLVTVQQASIHTGGAFHHLLVDPAMVGPRQWQAMITQIQQHLGLELPRINDSSTEW